MATILLRSRWGDRRHVSPKFEVDVTTHNGVMERFMEHYVPWNLDLWPIYTKSGVMWLGPNAEDICLFWSSYSFAFLKYSIIKCWICGPIAKQPVLPWQPFCAPLDLMSAPEYEVYGTTRNWGKAYILCTHVTLTFDIFSQKLGHVIWRSWWMYVFIWSL